MLHLLLAAALSAAPAKPLFVPPKGMARVAEDAWARSRIRGSRDATLVAEYRGTFSFKPSWSTVAYKISEKIAIVSRPTTFNAQEWGVRTFTGLSSIQVPPSVLAFCAHKAHCSIDVPQVKKIAAGPVALCNGQRGWMNAFTTSGEAYEQVFARARDRVYVAVLEYARTPGDLLHAASALRTLCPAGVGELPPPAGAVPLTAPKGWTRGVGDLGGDDSSYKVLAYWVYLPQDSTFGQYLTLGSASDVSEYITPEQEAAAQIDDTKAHERNLRVQAGRAVKLCGGSDAWFAQYTATDTRGSRYTAETMYAYGNDTSYLLRYVRTAGAPEDPAARKALYSLCPPQPATSGRI
ncbi:MAG TPA: hypothetical protein VJP85_11365 [Candidatus Baltobacteraceae bacterium]|nr:hypothetical protein [Candidatus Baltobacteraceae bacterium]